LIEFSYAAHAGLKSACQTRDRPPAFGTPSNRPDPKLGRAERLMSKSLSAAGGHHAFGLSMSKPLAATGRDHVFEH